MEEPALTSSGPQPRSARSLIEFPGVKNSIPQWRKELGERVREVQERKAREALIEAGETDLDLNDLESRVHLLELIPRTEAPPVNPIVVAALQRIERAHAHARYAGNAAVATMLAYDEQPELGFEAGRSDLHISDDAVPQEESAPPSAGPERVHKLAVVPRQVTTEMTAEESPSVDIPPIEAAPLDSPTLAVSEIENAELPTEAVETVAAPPQQLAKKPRRLIGDLNDPALNYLDSIPVTIVDIPERRSAPVFYRVLSGILDLAVVGLLSSPVVALVKLTDLKWQEPRTLMFAAGTFVTMCFLYLTISTAFTGRTLGMKAFSLRVVDNRTGLIPTGGQSAARAFLYLLSLASAGIALCYTFVNEERRAPHDRFTRTAVVRV
ncbi:MAG TPA: RDD family protein [Pyrinomonadaceae bacterium]|nr:RDD family protein [Pyrinomonadaceae bacterium]